MKNKNILFVIILVALLSLPWWRINHNSQFFVEGVFSQFSHLGDWDYQNFSVSVSGDIAIDKVQFKPHGYRQVINIDSITLSADVRDLLFTKSADLLVKLPAQLAVNFNHVQVADRSGDLQKNINADSYYPMVVGYLGAFGCGDNPEPSFSEQQWLKLFPQSPVFDIKLTYALVDDFTLDFNVNVNNIDNWFVTWSGSLTRSNNDDRLTFHDTILDTRYYYYADQGFNKRRNDMCSAQKNSSFAGYRLDSAEAVQQNLRVYAGGEMSQKLSNLYQRSLQPDVEYNAIFKLKEAKYIFEFGAWKQNDLLANSEIEAALGEQEYQAIKLSKIDYLNLDIDTLRNDMEQRKQLQKDQQAAEQQPKKLLRQVKTHIGGQQKNEVIVSNWASAIGQDVKVMTKRGRPVFGVLKAVNNQQITVTTRFKSGDATISIQRKDVLSISTRR